jgi:hypothetical protein
MLSAAAAFLLLGFTVPAFARQDKPEKQEEKPSAPKQEQPPPHEKQQEAKSPKRLHLSMDSFPGLGNALDTPPQNSKRNVVEKE